jgi:hypothetical protein
MWTMNCLLFNDGVINSDESYTKNSPSELFVQPGFDSTRVNKWEHMLNAKNSIIRGLPITL